LYARSTVSVMLSSKMTLERCAACWMLSVVLVVMFPSISVSCSAADQVRAGHQPQDRKDAGLEVPPSTLARADEVIE
jgi:hypothetical protein